MEKLLGVYCAIAIDTHDPEKRGRVKVRLSGVEESCEGWARIAVLDAGSKRGCYFVPENGDEVLVAFEAGDPRQPYVIGVLWNGHDQPPTSTNDAGHKHVKKILSHSLKRSNP